MRILAYMLGGWFFVALGVVGLFLPILPTTPFLLLASFCFVRSSPRLHRWLMNHRLFGRYVRDWEEKRAVRPGVKITAFTMMGTVAVLTTLFASLSPWLLGVLYGLLFVGATVVWRLPTAVNEAVLNLQEEGAIP